jgi:glycosyltransferase involved in cell wall biosynthesis
MPAYNEELFIINSLTETIKSLKNIEFEIIFVNDGSTDRTLQIVSNTKEFRGHVKIVTYAQNQGKGYASAVGFKASRGDPVVFFDADLEIHPRCILNLLSVKGNTGADIVVASNMHPESDTNFPPLRKLLTQVYYLAVRMFILPIRHEAGLKIFKREAFGKVLPLLVYRRYGAEIEQLALANKLGYSIVEAPISSRYKGTGGMDIHSFLHTGYETFALLTRLRVTGNYNQRLKICQNPQLDSQ